MPIGLFLVVVVLVLVIEKIELVKPVAKRIEDDNDDDIPARGVSPAKYLQFLTICCQKKRTKSLTRMIRNLKKYHENTEEKEVRFRLPVSTKRQQPVHRSSTLYPIFIHLIPIVSLTS